MEFRIQRNQQAVQGIPIGKLNELEFRVRALEAGGGGSGWTISTPTGSLYDQSTGLGGLSFTASGSPIQAVFADGAIYFDGAGCTISGTSITMDNPVTQFIRVAL